jgi:hypothetical protein
MPIIKKITKQLVECKIDMYNVFLMSDINLDISIIVWELFHLILFIIKTTFVDEIAKNNNPNRCQSLHD